MILPRAARAGRRGRTRGSSSRAPTSTTRSSAAAASGARPRFVWTITPVALSTRRSRGRRAGASSARTRSSRSPGSAPARISSRARSSTVRAASTASGSSSSRASSSTEGRSRRLHCASLPSRRRGHSRARRVVALDHELAPPRPGRPSRRAVDGRPARSSRRRSSSSSISRAGRASSPSRTARRGSCSTLPVWISVSASNSSSSVPKPPGKMTKPSLGFTSTSCARRSGANVYSMSRYGFGRCSCGSSMLKPDREPPPSCAPRFAASITPRSAAGHDREARLGEQPAVPRAAAYDGMVLADAAPSRRA